MKASQIVLNKDSKALEKLQESEPQFVLAFGSTNFFTKEKAEEIKKAAPKATIIGCSTAGEISNEGVDDDTLVLTAMNFDNYTDSTFKSFDVGVEVGSYSAGKAIAENLSENGLKTIFILSQGVNVNGSELIEGIEKVAGQDVLITGGLAGDGGKFEKTFTMINGEVYSDRIVAVGIYNDKIEFESSAFGGWEPFGPERKVTKADRNILFELDGKPALEIYKSYLGEHADKLPESGLLFPFAIVGKDGGFELIRTILGIDEASGSLILAGDVPVNGILRLMHSENNSLTDGAEKAAYELKESGKGSVSLLISCVGRKMVMGDDVDDEIDKVKEVLDPLFVSGFYSYGEIAPLKKGKKGSFLHNQTMTITTIKESA